MTDITRLTVDASMPEGWCSVCCRELEPGEAHMVMGTTAEEPKGLMVSVTICRSCLSELVPSMLAAVEAVGEQEPEEEIEPYGREFDAEDFPHGLRCTTCDKRIGEGDRYATQLHAFSSDGTPVVLLVCLECALGDEDA